MPFALAATVLLLSTVVSGWVMTTVREGEAVQAEHHAHAALFDAADQELRLVAKFFAAKAIPDAHVQGGEVNVSIAREAITADLNAYIAGQLERREIGRFRLHVSPAEVDFIAAEYAMRETLPPAPAAKVSDAAPPEADATVSSVESSNGTSVFFRVEARLLIDILDIYGYVDAPIATRGLSFTEVVEDGRLLLERKGIAFSERVGAGGEVERIFRHVFSSMAQAEASFGQGRFDPPRPLPPDAPYGPPVITDKERAAFALRFAVLLVIGRTYHAYPEGALQQLSDKYSFVGNDLEALVVGHSDGQPFDPADIVAISAGYRTRVIPIGEIVEQALIAAADQWATAYIKDAYDYTFGTDDQGFSALPTDTDPARDAKGYLKAGLGAPTAKLLATPHSVFVPGGSFADPAPERYIGQVIETVSWTRGADIVNETGVVIGYKRECRTQARGTVIDSDDNAQIGNRCYVRWSDSETSWSYAPTSATRAYTWGGTNAWTGVDITKIPDHLRADGAPIEKLWLAVADGLGSTPPQERATSLRTVFEQALSQALFGPHPLFRDALGPDSSIVIDARDHRSLSQAQADAITKAFTDLRNYYQIRINREAFATQFASNMAAGTGPQESADGAFLAKLGEIYDVLVVANDRQQQALAQVADAFWASGSATHDSPRLVQTLDDGPSDFVQGRSATGPSRAVSAVREAARAQNNGAHLAQHATPSIRASYAADKEADLAHWRSLVDAAAISRKSDFVERLLGGTLSVVAGSSAGKKLFDMGLSAASELGRGLALADGRGARQVLVSVPLGDEIEFWEGNYTTARARGAVLKDLPTIDAESFRRSGFWEPRFEVSLTSVPGLHLGDPSEKRFAPYVTRVEAHADAPLSFTVRSNLTAASSLGGSDGADEHAIHATVVLAATQIEVASGWKLDVQSEYLDGTSEGSSIWGSVLSKLKDSLKWLLQQLLAILDALVTVLGKILHVVTVLRSILSAAENALSMLSEGVARLIESARAAIFAAFESSLRTTSVLLANFACKVPLVDHYGLPVNLLGVSVNAQAWRPGLEGEKRLGLLEAKVGGGQLSIEFRMKTPSCDEALIKDLTQHSVVFGLLAGPFLLQLDPHEAEWANKEPELEWTRPDGTVGQATVTLDKTAPLVVGYVFRDEEGRATRILSAGARGVEAGGTSLTISLWSFHKFRDRLAYYVPPTPVTPALLLQFDAGVRLEGLDLDRLDDLQRQIAGLAGLSANEVPPAAPTDGLVDADPSRADAVRSTLPTSSVEGALSKMRDTILRFIEDITNALREILGAFGNALVFFARISVFVMGGGARLVGAAAEGQLVFNIAGAIEKLLEWAQLQLEGMLDSVFAKVLAENPEIVARGTERAARLTELSSRGALYETIYLGLSGGFLLPGGKRGYWIEGRSNLPTIWDTEGQGHTHVALLDIDETGPCGRSAPRSIIVASCRKELVFLDVWVLPPSDERANTPEERAVAPSCVASDFTPVALSPRMDVRGVKMCKLPSGGATFTVTAMGSTFDVEMSLSGAARPVALRVHDTRIEGDVEALTLVATLGDGAAGELTVRVRDVASGKLVARSTGLGSVQVAQYARTLRCSDWPTAEGTGPPVVLLHGIFGSPCSFQDMTTSLAASHRVLDFDPLTPGVQGVQYVPYASTNGVAWMAAKVVQGQIFAAAENAGISGTPVSIVGHSAGGLVGRFLAEHVGASVEVSSLVGYQDQNTVGVSPLPNDVRANTVSRLVMVATPNDGVWIELLFSLRACGSAFGPGTLPLARWAQFGVDLVDPSASGRGGSPLNTFVVDLYDRAPPPAAAYTTVAGRMGTRNDDCVVDIASVAHPHQASADAIFPGDHGSIVTSPLTIDRVVNALQ